MKNTVVLALATMLGVGYLVFRSGSVVISAPSQPSPSEPSVLAFPGESERRRVMRFAPSAGPSTASSNPIWEPALPAWFIKSVETPLPKQFVGKIYERNIAAIKGRGL